LKNVLRKAEAWDGAEAQVGEGVHNVEVDEVYEVKDEAEAQVIDGYDLPMSIYSQLSLFVSRLLRSIPRSVFKLVKDLNKDLKEIPISYMKSLYFIQSAYSIYLCMYVAIFSFYILLEVVNSDNES
jgi:hypothetical protein